jgi:hypothetical protein
MIKKKATGDLETFARKNGLCKSAMAGVIQEMKELGFPIKFDRTQNTYYYAEDGEMVQTLFIKNGKFLSKEEMAEIGHIDNLCFSQLTVFRLCENK